MTEKYWAEYLEALKGCCEATKLTAYWTKECAEATEKVASLASLAAFCVKEVNRHG